jgi:hypothetical protein
VTAMLAYASFLSCTIVKTTIARLHTRERKKKDRDRRETRDERKIGLASERKREIEQDGGREGAGERVPRI